MAEIYTDEWYAEVLAASASLPAVDGVSFCFDVEVADAPGKKRAHGRVVDGQLTSFAAGKFVAEGDEAVQVSFATKGKYMPSLLSGDESPLVSYMRGYLKVDGEYELVIDHLANQCDKAAMDSFRAEVANLTD